MKRHERVRIGASGRRSASRWVSMLAIPIALGLIAAACGDSGDDAGGASQTTAAVTTTTLQPQSGGTLTFAAYSNIPGLDPIVALGSGTSGAIQMATIYDTLVRYDTEKKIYTPDMLESFTANADSTEWTLKIQPGTSSSPTAPTSTPKPCASA